MCSTYQGLLKEAPRDTGDCNGGNCPQLGCSPKVYGEESCVERGKQDLKKINEQVVKQVCPVGDDAQFHQELVAEHCLDDFVFACDRNEQYGCVEQRQHRVFQSIECVSE